jgi:hypothetical protein
MKSHVIIVLGEANVTALDAGKEIPEIKNIRNYTFDTLAEADAFREGMEVQAGDGWYHAAEVRLGKLHLLPKAFFQGNDADDTEPQRNETKKYRAILVSGTDAVNKAVNREPLTPDTEGFWDELEFDTEAELHAFCKGVDSADGWWDNAVYLETDMEYEELLKAVRED